MPDLDAVLSAALGIGLAAATEFRVFLPLLVLSLAANAGDVWLSTPSALAMLAIAATAEILA